MSFYARKLIHKNNNKILAVYNLKKHKFLPFSLFFKNFSCVFKVIEPQWISYCSQYKTNCNIIDFIFSIAFDE